MKKILFAIIAIVLSASATKASSGDLQIGAKTQFYTRWDGIVGIGPMVKYDINDMFRVESALLLLTKKGASIDWSIDLHMPFQLSSSFEIYPLAGISLNDPYKFGVALGLGGGANYNINDRWVANAGVKWSIQSQQYLKNPFIIACGIGYKL
ncbi:MAG: porin family protein [Rikenellaceae bacterium]